MVILLVAYKLDWLRRIGLSFLIPYLFLVFAVTVFLRSPSEKSQLLLEPFWSYRQYYSNDFTWFEIRANVLLFIPIGFFLPMVIKKPFYRASAACFAQRNLRDGRFDIKFYWAHNRVRGFLVYQSSFPGCKVHYNYNKEKRIVLVAMLIAAGTCFI